MKRALRRSERGDEAFFRFLCGSIPRQMRNDMNVNEDCRHKHPSTTGPFLVIERPIFFSSVEDRVDSL